MRVRWAGWWAELGLKDLGERDLPWLGPQHSRPLEESCKTLLSPCIWSLSRAPSSAVRALASSCLCLCERQLWGAGGICQPAPTFTATEKELAGDSDEKGVPHGNTQATYHLKAT